MINRFSQVLFASLFVTLSACGGGGGGGAGSNSSAHNDWTWMKGSSVVNDPGSYGDSGLPEPYMPSARTSAVSWVDSSGKFWLFGGFGIDSTGSSGALNNLWRFDGTNWVWLKGSDLANRQGTYADPGISAPNSTPGSRDNAASFVSGGKLWLFGGYGYDSAGNVAALNDLWSFDGTNWTWVNGSNVIDQSGYYGSKNVPAANNVPGARSGAVTWVDSSGNLWMFGGWGRDKDGTSDYLNDLWKFDGTQWTWVHGSDVVNARGVYGTQGVANAANVPGARREGVSWIDSSGNLWLFGGHGYDSGTAKGYLGDLWKFDGTHWTWVSGGSGINTTADYGIKGTSAANNHPGARYMSVSWRDQSGNMWLFGGRGYGHTSLGWLNDVWRFDGVNWTWVSGSDTLDQSGNYGTQGVTSQNNMPGARHGSVTWQDSKGNLWLFGGDGWDSNGTRSGLNDLWRYRP